MKSELEKVLVLERKNKRQLAELRNLKHKLSHQVNPDPRLVKMVDEEIASLLK